MMKNLLRENRTLRELLIGTWLFGAIIEIILAVFFPPVWYRTIGLLFGLIAASGMAIHMAYCIELTVCLDEKGANSYVKKMTIIRYIAVCALLVAVALTGIGDPVSYVIGALGLKIGAYLQPVISKLIRVIKKEDLSDTVINVDFSVDMTNVDTEIESVINNNDKGGE